LGVAEAKVKVNGELGLQLKAQVLHEMGRNYMLKSSVDNGQRGNLIEEAEKYVADAI
jgi:hypothetical protein